MKTKRKDFTNTSKYSVLCEKTLCYPMEYSIKKAMGLEEEMFASRRNTYNPHGRYDAVKKTMHVSITGELYASFATKKKNRALFRKRECMRVSCIKCISKMNFTERRVGVLLKKLSTSFLNVYLCILSKGHPD